jgi:hypothetical protein
MDQKLFQDVVVAAEMRATHPTGFIEVRVGSFQALSALPLQASRAHGAHPATIRMYGVARRHLTAPAATPTIGLDVHRCGVEFRGRPRVDERGCVVAWGARERHGRLQVDNLMAITVGTAAQHTRHRALRHEANASARRWPAVTAI